MNSCMQNKQYYVSHRESNALKGALILLIVLGHIHTLNLQTVAGDMRTYLYSFHVMCFFIIPFFYNPQNQVLSWKKTLDIIVRTWIPYLWILILCLLAVYFVKRQFHLGLDSFLAFINGTQTPLAKSFGFVFPWFLPAYCSSSILLMIGRRYRLFYWLITVLSVGTFFFSYDQFFALKMYLPFALGLAICYFALGAIAFALNRIAGCIRYVMALLFVALSVCWWIHLELPQFIYKFLPITFFFLLLSLMPIIDCRFLRSIGRCSLGIYLFNVFFANAAYMLLPHSMIYGLLTFVLSVLLPWAITKGINDSELLRRLLFPRSLKEFFWR